MQGFQFYVLKFFLLSKRIFEGFELVTVCVECLICKLQFKLSEYNALTLYNTSKLFNCSESEELDLESLLKSIGTLADLTRHSLV